MIKRDELVKLIDLVKAANGYGEIELWGNKKSFDELRAAGFSLEGFKCREVEFTKPKIMIVPA